MATTSNMNGRTPEEFEAAGITLDAAYDAAPGSEWRRRVHAGLPYKAPVATVGAWMYNPLANENQRVLRVVWDAGIPGCCRGGWRYHLPGYSAFDAISAGAHDSVPYVEYVETTSGSHCWRRERQVSAPTAT